MKKEKYSKAFRVIALAFGLFLAAMILALVGKPDPVDSGNAPPQKTSSISSGVPKAMQRITTPRANGDIAMPRVQNNAMLKESEIDDVREPPYVIDTDENATCASVGATCGVLPCCNGRCVSRGAKSPVCLPMKICASQGETCETRDCCSGSCEKSNDQYICTN